MTKIHKEVYGQGKPIVLIHGWAMHTGIWRLFAQQLAKNYQVTCLDLPGHGLSEIVEPYSLDKISDELISNMPKTSFCLLGWSLGASVALRIAKKYPQKIESLILLAGNPRFVDDDDWMGINPDLLDEFAANLTINCQLSLIRFLALQVNGLENGKQILKELKQAVHECDPPEKGILLSGLNILKNEDLRKDLATIDCPINIIQGDKDTLVPVQVTQKMQKIQPRCEINIISRAGHTPFLSHQTDVIKIINRFI